MHFEDSIRKICTIYCVSNNKNITNCLFKLDLKDINLDQTFNQLLSKKEDIKGKDEILSINEPITKETDKEIDIIVYEKESFFQKNKIKIIISLSILCLIIIIAIILIIVLTKKSDSDSDSEETENHLDSTTISQYPMDSKEITQELTTERVTKICEPGYFIPDDDENLEDCTKCSLEGCIECKGTYATNECINCGDLESIFNEGKIIECKKTCIKGQGEKCLTCAEDSLDCASCNFGYRLINGKCRPTFYIKAVYHVKAEEDNIDLFSSLCLSVISYLIIEGKNIIPSTVSYKFENAGDQTVYIQYKKTTQGSSYSKCFSNIKNLISVTFTDFDEYFPNLGYQSLFEGCSNLISVDLTNTHKFNWAYLDNMFKDCFNLVHIDFIKFKFAANSTTDMFRNCYSLTSIDLSKLDISKVKSLSYMFYNCNSLQSLDLSSFQSYILETMHSTFYNCFSLTSINLNNMYTSKVYEMNYLFYNCTSLKFLDISSFNTENVLYMGGMFQNCNSLTSIIFGNNFKTNKVQEMYNMFYNCYKLRSIDLSKFVIKNKALLRNMMRGCYSLTSLNFQSSVSTSLIIDGIFYDCPNLTYINFSFVSSAVQPILLFNGNISNSATLILKKSFYDDFSYSSFNEQVPSNWNLRLID